MIYPNRYILALITSFIASQSQTFFFADLDNILDEQIKMMEEMRDARQKLKDQNNNNFFNAFSLPTISINELEKEHKIEVVIKEIKNDSFEATLNPDNDTLTITTPSEKIIIKTNRNALSAYISQEERKEQKEKEKQEADKEQEAAPTYYYFGSASSQTSQSFAYPISLEHQSIQYNKADNSLTITIPVPEKQKGKSVPVTIIDKTK